MVEVRPATAADIAAVYGEPPKRSMRAYAALVDGEAIAVAGVYYYPDQVVAFSRINPAYEHLRTGLGRGALKVIQMLKNMNVPVLAVAEPGKETAPAFLERCGFEHMKTTKQGEVYVWRHRH
jgi:hypothetical protein